MSLLPNPHLAVVELIKLHGYCLNPDHHRGQHKARIFASVLGLTSDQAELLQQALLAAARNRPAHLTTTDEYGQRYRLDFVLTGPNGRQATVRSIWIVRRGETFARLVTCYVL